MNLNTILDIRITINILQYSAESAGTKKKSPADTAGFRRKIRRCTSNLDSQITNYNSQFSNYNPRLTNYHLLLTKKSIR